MKKLICSGILLVTPASFGQSEIEQHVVVINNIYDCYIQRNASIKSDIHVTIHAKDANIASTAVQAAYSLSTLQPGQTDLGNGNVNVMCRLRTAERR